MYRYFEFRAYPGDEFGDIAEHPAIYNAMFKNETAAKGKAGRLSKKINGPVDIAHGSDSPWNERYITTAMPSEFHATGYRFERLD